MGFRVQRKLALFTALAALTGTAVVSTLAYWSAEQALHDGLRAQAMTTASMLAVRAGEELKDLAERGRYYTASAQRTAFESDGELLALTIIDHRATPNTGSGDGVDGPTQDWQPTLRWTLPESAPLRLSDAEVAGLDLKTPIDYERIAQGQSDALFARKGAVAVLRAWRSLTATDRRIRATRARSCSKPGFPGFRRYSRTARSFSPS